MTSAAMPNSASRPWPAIRAGKCDRAGQPSFAGDFLPARRVGRRERVRSDYRVGNLALGRSLVSTGGQIAAPTPTRCRPARADASEDGPQTAQINLISPSNLYSQVNRATKYGFLFIGFTFLALVDVRRNRRGTAVYGGRIFADGGNGHPILRLCCSPLPKSSASRPALSWHRRRSPASTPLMRPQCFESWRRASLIGGLLVGLFTQCSMSCSASRLIRCWLAHFCSSPRLPG